jgi:Fic family protein
MTSEDRHSRALDAELITDDVLKAQQEARNGLKQFDTVIEMVDYWLQPERAFRLRLSAILNLHRVALEGLSGYAGNFRPSAVSIRGSKHQPCGAFLVPSEVEALCDYVNENWRKPAIHLAAFVLWKLNWIHPFTDGNGRTSRALSYLVLCVRLGVHLPGTNAIPEQIAANKLPYYEALERADIAESEGRADVSALEDYLSSLLAKQLLSVLESATGKAAE